MTSNDTCQLPVSARDIQFLVALGVSFGTYIAYEQGAAPEEAVDQNDAALGNTFAYYFSADEFNTLILRLKALLPPDTALKFVAPSGDAYVH